MAQTIPISIQRGTPVTDENPGKSGLDSEIKGQQESSKRELASVFQPKSELAPPAQSQSRSGSPALDSMASRIPRYLDGPAFSDEQLFENMGSRIGNSPVFV